MNNAEKFKEIFGEVGNDVHAKPSWLGAEYNGPVKRTELKEFEEWLDNIYYLKSEKEADGLYIYLLSYAGSLQKTPLLRLSDFDVKPGKAYMRWDGLTGWIEIEKAKDIIKTEARKNDPLDSLSQIIGNTDPFNILQRKS